MDGRLSILGTDILCECATSTVRIPLTDATLAQLTEWTIAYRTGVRNGTPTTLVDLGRAIFGWLDETGWATTWVKGTGPRRLEIAVEETASPAAIALLDLPWELLVEQNDFLAGDATQPFVVFRSIHRLPNATPPPPRHRDLAVMFMAASPAGQQELSYEDEEAAILDATERLPLQLVVEESGCADFLKERWAQEGPFEALHLSCHGTILATGTPVLLLETPEGNGTTVQPGELIATLGEEQASLLFLSACRTAEAGTERGGDVTESFVRSLIRAGVANVLGWDGSVYDRDATAFAETFYSELADFATPQYAAALARTRLLRAHYEDPNNGRHWHLARLYVGPNGGGPCCDRGKPRRRLRRDAGFNEFLDKANSRVPVATAQTFVGRRKEAQRILHAFRQRESSGILLYGMGNLGKSSLAARIANRLPRHRTVVIYDRYDASAIWDALVDALPPAARAGWRATWDELIRNDGSLLADALEALLEGPFAEEPIFLIIDDLEQILADPRPEAGLPGVKDAPGSRETWRVSLAAVLRAFAAAESPSHLLLTSRYRFTLPDGRGRDLADLLTPLQLRPMRRREQLKQWQAATRVTQRGRGETQQRVPTPTGDPELVRLRHRAIGVAGGNPGLQEILCRPILAGERDAAAAAIDAITAWKASGAVPQEASAAQEFFQRVTFRIYRDALTSEQREQLRATTLFREGLAVPLPALAAAGRALGVADPDGALARLIGLGLVDQWEPVDGVLHGAANPLARPLVATAAETAGLTAGEAAGLTAAEAATLATAALDPLAAAWRSGEGDGHFPYDERGVEAARLALLGDAPAELLAAAANPAAYHLYEHEHNATAALTLCRQTLARLAAQDHAPHPDFLRRAAACAERIGETGEQIALLERGLALPSDDQRAMAQLVVVYAEATRYRDGPDQALERLYAARAIFEEIDDIRERAVTMGKIADILQGRGETDEALRIRREEELPVYERLGDIRSRAVTMGKIADILQGRGETDEALRIHLEERLPVAQRIQDMDLLAHVRFACARIRLARGGLQGDEAQTIVDELGESFTLSRRLQRVDAIAAVGSLLGQVLAAVGLTTDAITVLEEAAAAFARMGQATQAAQLQAWVAQLQGQAQADDGAAA